MSHPFKGSRLKIDRAKHHVSDLNAKVEEFLAANPNVLIIDDYLGGGCYTAKHIMHLCLPDSWALITGDAVHNLRASLDYLACSLVRLNGKDPKDVHFPFSRVRGGSDLENQIGNKKMDLAAKDVVDIVRALKPYDGGNQPLWNLHDLDLGDKHRWLLPIERAPSRFFIHKNGKFFNVSTGIEGPKTEADGKTWMIDHVFANEGDLNINEQFHAPAHILFGEGPFEGEPVVPTLHQLVQLVDGIVATFASHLKI